MNGEKRGPYNPLTSAVQVLNALLLILITGAVLAGIAARAIGRPIAHLEEIGPDLFLWLTLLGTADAVHRGSHLRTEWLISRMSPAWRRWIDTATAMVALLFLGTILIRGWDAARMSAIQGEMAPAGYPAWIMMAALPAGAGLAILFCLLPSRRRSPDPTGDGEI